MQFEVIKALANCVIVGRINKWKGARKSDRFGLDSCVYSLVPFSRWELGNVNVFQASRFFLLQGLPVLAAFGIAVPLYCTVPPGFALKSASLCSWFLP